jgi:hypothetical protein
MTLHSADRLVVGFDELSHDVRRLSYRLEHCEADWSTSEDIFESDWLNGGRDNHHGESTPIKTKKTSKRSSFLL